MPFEEMNSAQNHYLVHGQGVYLKGVTHRGPDHPSLEAYTHLIAMIAKKHLYKPQFRLRIVFEYFPLSKMNSVPRGTTAFRKNEELNILIVVVWTPGASAGAREALDLGDGEGEYG